MPTLIRRDLRLNRASKRGYFRISSNRTRGIDGRTSDAPWQSLLPIEDVQDASCSWGNEGEDASHATPSLFARASSIAATSPAGLGLKCGMASRVIAASITVGLPDASAACSADSKSAKVSTR